MMWLHTLQKPHLSLFHRSGVCYKERKKGDRIKLRRMHRKIGVHAFQILTGYHRFLGEENMHRALWITLVLNLLLWIRFVKGPNPLTQNFHANYGSCNSILINCLNTNMSLLSRWNNMNINDKLPAYLKWHQAWKTHLLWTRAPVTLQWRITEWANERASVNYHTVLVLFI